MRDYNFFEIFEKRRGINFSPRSPYFLGGLIVILCVLLSAGLLGRNYLITKQIEEMNAEIDQIKASADYILANEYQNSLDAMSDYEKAADAAFDNFQAANTLDSILIEELFKGIPSNATITNFTIINTGFSMTCNIPDRKAAAELIAGLKGTDLVHEIQLNSVSRQEGNIYKVTLDGVLKVGDPR